ncbi:hypothetical protein CPB83DRAFT_864999 [Crepidotus variabilis]|uniref:Uncharacterized protein n=1 Tax=Crepidotus variabilis TaxID=179855 RepID=A0A9P6JIE2_9AGAR|nr:hypothetical protein CPB83DRAFT_864999 [Crepidotus variabilis]
MSYAFFYFAYRSLLRFLLVSLSFPIPRLTRAFSFVSSLNLLSKINIRGTYVAAGSVIHSGSSGNEASILYWDPRQPSFPLRAHNETHSDDITSLVFLLSGRRKNFRLNVSHSSRSRTTSRSPAVLLVRRPLGTIRSERTRR